MKITALSPNFTSKKPLVKKADDIVRHTNLQYPTFSPSYANNAWVSAKFYTKSLDRKSEILQQHLIPKLNQYRDEYDKTQETDEFHLDIIRKMKEYKIANCNEKTWLTMGALAANGYTHFCKVSVMIGIDAIDKRTGKKAFESYDSYDHCAIATTMEDKGGAIKNSIIVDPWLNKAMTYNEAQVEYLNLIPIWEIRKRIEKTKSKIADYMAQDCGIFGKRLPIDFDIENYEFEVKVFFKRLDSMHEIKDHKEAREFGELVKEEFPELLIEEF